jgi:hypothetical protein
MYSYKDGSLGTSYMSAIQDGSLGAKMVSQVDAGTSASVARDCFVESKVGLFRTYKDGTYKAGVIPVSPPKVVLGALAWGLTIGAPTYFFSKGNKIRNAGLATVVGGILYNGITTWRSSSAYNKQMLEKYGKVCPED